MFESRRELTIWLAGFLEGEGSFVIILDQNSVFSGRLTAGQANPSILELLKDTFGGQIRQNKRSYSSRFSTTLLYQWTITGPAMYKALLELRPYLFVKAEQADCLIQLQESINSYKGRIGRNREFQFLPEEEWIKRAALYNRCKGLKRGLAAETEREGLQEIEGSNSPSCIDDKNAELAEMTNRLN